MSTRPPWEDFRASSTPAAGPWSDYQASEPDAPRGALLGGAGATMSAAQPEGLTGVWNEAARKLKEAIFGHPDRAEAKAAGIGLQPTPAELGEAALAGGAAMLGGSAMGGIAAAPVRAGVAMAGGYAGEKAGRGVGELAESAGAPSGTAAVAGTVGALAGAASPARALRSLAGGRAGAVLEVVNPRAAAGLRAMMGGAEAAAAAPAAAPAAAQAEEITAKVLSLRQKGLSGAQITSSLRQLYGIPPGQGQKMVSMILESMKSGARVR